MEAAAVERWLQENYLSRGQAARLAGVSAEWIRALAANGKIATLETPAGRLFLREHVEQVAASREETGG